MGSHKRERRLILVALGVAVIAAGSLAAIAGALGGASTSAGGAVTAVKVVRSSQDATTSSVWGDLPGASTSIGVPKGTHAIILVRFSAASHCASASSIGFCRVRILIDGHEASPSTAAGGHPYVAIFDTTNSSNTESHSIERSRFVGAGTHTVRAQFDVVLINSTFTLHGWNMTVERVRSG
jgi:hypothetical protein